MKFFLLFSVLFFLFLLPLGAQEEDQLFDWDIDTIFDAPPEEELPPEESPPDQITEKNSAKEAAPEKKAVPVSAASLVKPRGITFNASFEFLGGVAPGWEEAPWFFEKSEKEEKGFVWEPSMKMVADFSIDAQISETFRVYTGLKFHIPQFALTLGNFYADYSIFDTVFLRAGKYSLSWGISPNFHITNLLSRVPDPKIRKSGTPFILKADIPIGIGGFQFLALTRADLMKSAEFTKDNLAYGGKYNLALRWADFDLGVFYEKGMPLRSFLSIKTTIGNTELYNEWVASVDIDKSNDFSGAVNIGFGQSFFNNKFQINGELLYNAETNSYWYASGTSLRDPLSSPLMNDLNIALNLLYRFDGWGSPRLFVQTLYAPRQESARLVPGIRLNPFPHAELYVAVPMALGSRDGYYYQNTLDPRTRPFCVVVLLSFKGGVRAGYYY